MLLYGQVLSLFLMRLHLGNFLDALIGLKICEEYLVYLLMVVLYRDWVYYDYQDYQ
jgi:hypothetical protein